MDNIKLKTTDKTDQSTQLLIQKTGYQKFAPNYDRLLNKIILDNKYRKQMIKEMKLKKGDHVLILACGTGRDFEHVLDAISSEGKITAVDLTPEMLEQAQAKIIKNGWFNIELICANASEIKFDTKFDAAICSFAMSVIPDYISAFNSMSASVVKNGAIGILDVKSPSSKFLLKFIHKFIRYFMPEYYEDRPILEMMKNKLKDIREKSFYFGYIYYACGTN